MKVISFSNWSQWFIAWKRNLFREADRKLITWRNGTGLSMTWACPWNWLAPALAKQFHTNKGNFPSGCKPAALSNHSCVHFMRSAIEAKENSNGWWCLKTKTPWLGAQYLNKLDPETTEANSTLKIQVSFSVWKKKVTCQNRQLQSGLANHKNRSWYHSQSDLPLLSLQ